MADIKSLDRIASKWKEVASRSQGEYKEGVENPKRSWSAATQAAESAYEQGVQDSISRKAFGKGVSEAGDSKWKNRAVNLGPSRYSAGVAVAQPEYQKGFAPFHSVISSVTLPPRGPKGSPENIERVRVIASALHSAKVS